jgi:hypothetical protein
MTNLAKTGLLGGRVGEKSSAGVKKGSLGGLSGGSGDALSSDSSTSNFPDQLARVDIVEGEMQ